MGGWRGGTEGQRKGRMFPAPTFGRLLGRAMMSHGRDELREAEKRALVRGALLAKASLPV